MVAQIIAGFITFAVIVLVIGLFSLGFIRYFKDRHDSELFPNLIAGTGLLLVLSSLALVPVDIFIFSSTTDSKTGEKQEWADQETVDSLKNTISILYYVLYSVMMVFSFVLIPFAYFYFEEGDEDGTKKRILGALKYTVFTVIIMVVLLLLGLFLSPGEKDPSNPQWYLDLLTASSGIRAVCFMIACLTVMGILVFCLYTAYGLTALPLGLIKGKPELQQEELEALDELETVREKQRTLQARYIGGRKMNRKDKKELDDLEKRERLLARRSNVIEHNRNSLKNLFIRYTRPIQIFLGVTMLLLGLAIYVSIFLTSLDKLLNSYCGSSCGFILQHSEIFNPLDFALLYMSKVFPIDYIFMVAIFLYFFCATLSGIARIGIRFFWVHLYDIRPHRTAPQGLLLTSILLMLALLFVNVTLLTIAPDYATFGYQKYCNLTLPENETPCKDNPDFLLPCGLDAPEGACSQTAFSSLIARIMVLTPFFGIVFLAGELLFLLAVIIGLIVFFCRKQRQAILLESDSEASE